MNKPTRERIYGFLRWSERFTQTDMVYLTKGGAWLGLNRTVGTITALLLSVGYANFLSQEDYGAYQYLISILSILALAALPGMNTALSRAAALGFEGLIIPAVRTKFRWGLLGAGAGLATAAYYFLNGNAFLGTGFLVGSIAIPLVGSTDLYGFFLSGKKLFREAALQSIFFQTTLTAGILAALFLTRDVIVLITAYFTLTFVLQTVLLVRVIRKYQENSSVDSTALSFGKHLSLMNTLGTAVSYLDKILMWHFFGPAPLAVYAFATLPVDHLRLFLKSLSPIAFPKLAARNPHILKKTLPSKIMRAMALLLIPTAAYMLLAPYIFELIFPQYMESVPFTQFYAILLVLMPLMLFSTAITAHARKHDLYKIKGVNALTRIVLMLLLLPFFGILGLLSALLLATVLEGAISYHFFKRM